jgi:RNA polymerase sigma-54 factor
LIVAIQQKLGLSTRLSQRLILTPSLQQAIKLLPLTTLELAEVLEQEMTANPLLEEEPPQETLASTLEEPAPLNETPDRLDDIDVEKFFEDYMEDFEARPARGTFEVPEAPPLENTLSESPDLYDHLLWQLRMSTSDELLLEIGEVIIHNLEEDGLLRTTVDELENLGPYPREEVQRALAFIQSLDPPGVAARDVAECLRLQLRHLGLEDSLTDVMVRDHFKLLTNHQYSEIARQMTLTPEDVAQHVAVIRGLDPRPGLRYSSKKAQYITPDVFVVREGEEYKIALNDDGLPRLRISPTYRRMLDTREGESAETRSYVKDKLRSALWLLKSVDQRQRTIYKVADSIVRHQRGFLERGLGHLRPLVLRDVANDIGMHESTVSRVVANKYMHTPRGVYEMRFFFHSGIASNRGEAVSSVTVKDKIRRLVDGENAARPLSDARIAELLKAEGLTLARRTVAKYREELRIPPSGLRRAAT